MPKSFMPEPPAPTRLLTIELVPSTSWFNNVRTAVSAADWEKCKRMVRHRSQDRCEICAGRGPKWPVECHEVKHMGFAQTRGRAEQALQHLAKVRGWTFQEAETYAESCFELWAARSQYEWTVDLSYLATLGIEVPEKPKTSMERLREDYA